MKLEKLEWAVLAVTLLALALMASLFLGRRAEAGPITVTACVGPAAATPSSEAAAVSDGPEETFPLNINTATAEELEALPGIGASRAQAIVDYREEYGPFTYVEDLRSVPGIGEGILDSLMDYVTVGAEAFLDPAETAGPDLADEQSKGLRRRGRPHPSGAEYNKDHGTVERTERNSAWQKY